jgi:hypothetical protein
MMTRRVAYLAILSLSAAAVPMVIDYQLTRNFTPSLIPASAQTALMDFPQGTGTPSEVCGACHKAIYEEFSEGFGSDLRWTKMKNCPSSEPKVAVLEGVAKGVSPSTTAHAAAGTDPWPIDAVKVEENGKDCNVCHYSVPLAYPDMNTKVVARPSPRTPNHAGGITCVTCHLTLYCCGAVGRGRVAQHAAWSVAQRSALREASESAQPLQTEPPCRELPA